MAYTLYFSDSRKSGTIVVPGTSTGPGKNNYDTSLEFVGPGYVNYGTAIAQNFLKLLENFSGPTPPQNPIEGQLWYDTSDTNRKILRVHNASPTSKGWPTSSGIYQQSTDPADPDLFIDSNDNITSIKDGDLWANLSTGQLNLRSGNQWVVVGPNVITGAQKTGFELTNILSSQGGVSYPIIQKFVAGEVVEIISFNDFTPRTVINGFSTIKAGSNLTSRNNAKYNGTAERALELEISRGNTLKASEILRNRATRQVHTGTLVIESISGLIVRSPASTRSIQIADTPAGGSINFDNPSFNFKIGVNFDSYLSFDGVHKNIGINTSTSSTSPTLDVNGSGRFRGKLTAETSEITNSQLVQGRLTVSGPVLLSSQTTASGLLTLGLPPQTGILPPGGPIMEPASNDVYDIGTPTKRFRSVYASRIGTDTSEIFGIVKGSTQKLEVSRAFTITGDVQANTQSFDGTSAVNFTTTLTPFSISARPASTSTFGGQTLLVLNTTTSIPILEKISKSMLLSDVYPGLVRSGIIVPTGISNSSLMPGYLLCDGSPYNQAAYPLLFNAIGSSYGTAGPGTFRVPDLTNVTASVAGFPLYYYIKI